MVAAATTVQRQTFYWVGSNTAMINAGFSQVPAGSTVGYGFSGPWGYHQSFGSQFPTTATGDVYWGDAANWMVQVRGSTLTTAPNPVVSSTGGFASGASAGNDLGGITSIQKGYYWQPATRIPHRGDTVIFKYIPVDHAAGLTFTAPLSPCLFGGRGNSGGNMWIGDVLGGMTTGNANAIGEVRKIVVEKSYFEQDAPEGTIPRTGFISWGMPDYITDPSADGMSFSGINIKAQFVEINGCGVTAYGTDGAGTRSDNNKVYISDLEDCGEVTLRSKSLDIYGGTCNNLIIESYIPTGLTGFINPTNPTQVIEGGGGGLPTFGFISTKCSVLNTIRMTPTLLNSFVSISDPGGSCQNFVYGPYAKDARTLVAYYTNGVNTITRKPTQKVAADSTIRTLTNKNEISAPEVGNLTNTNFSGGVARLFRQGSSLYVGGFTSGTQYGLGSVQRTEIQNLMFDDHNSWDDTIAQTNFSENSRLGRDYRSFNNGIALNSGMTIQNINLTEGNLHISSEHDGGNTYDFDYNNNAIGISAGYIGFDGQLDMRHPSDFSFANIFVGESTSSDPNRGVLVLSGGKNSIINFAPTHFAKWGPPASGQTGGASESTQRSRSVRRTLPSRQGN